jgi:hypothetical protein
VAREGGWVTVFAGTKGCSPAPWDAGLVVGLQVDGVLIVNLLLSSVLILFY